MRDVTKLLLDENFHMFDKEVHLRVKYNVVTLFFKRIFKTTFFAKSIMLLSNFYFCFDIKCYKHILRNKIKNHTHIPQKTANKNHLYKSNFE